MDDDSDEQLGARLGSALRDLDGDRVDVATLLQGSRRRAQRVRTRRIATGAAAAVLVICVPLGYEVINPQPGGTAPPAVLLPSGSYPAQPRGTAPTPRPDPTAAATAVPPTAVPTDAPTGPADSRSTWVPDAFSFSPAELPAGLAFDRTSANAGQVLVDGMQCSVPAGTGPSAGRQWRWASGDGTAGETSVSLTVTRWPDGPAAFGLLGVLDRTGPCRWLEPQTPRSFAPARVDQAWASTSTASGAYRARSVIRIGYGIVGIEVRHPKSAATAARIADELAVIEAGRLTRNPL